MDELAETKNNPLNPAEWVDQYGDKLYRYALSRLRDADAAAEVVQQTFVAGLKNIDQYSGKGSEIGWLMGILKRKIIDFVRARNRTASYITEEGNDPSEMLFDKNGNWQTAGESTDDRPFDSLEREEFWQTLQKCLKALPAQHADVFSLRELEEQSAEEICKDLQITASNLWVILYRARLKLATCMEARWRLS